MPGEVDYLFVFSITVAAKFNDPDSQKLFHNRRGKKNEYAYIPHVQFRFNPWAASVWKYTANKRSSPYPIKATRKSTCKSRINERDSWHATGFRWPVVYG
jgi:hypothetical protein